MSSSPPTASENEADAPKRRSTHDIIDLLKPVPVATPQDEGMSGLALLPGSRFDEISSRKLSNKTSGDTLSACERISRRDRAHPAFDRFKRTAFFVMSACFVASVILFCYMLGKMMALSTEREIELQDPYRVLELMARLQKKIVQPVCPDLKLIYSQALNDIPFIDHDAPCIDLYSAVCQSMCFTVPPGMNLADVIYAYEMTLQTCRVKTNDTLDSERINEALKHNYKVCTGTEIRDESALKEDATRKKFGEATQCFPEKIQAPSCTKREDPYTLQAISANQSVFSLNYIGLKVDPSRRGLYMIFDGRMQANGFAISDGGRQCLKALQRWVNQLDERIYDFSDDEINLKLIVTISVLNMVSRSTVSIQNRILFSR